MRIIALLLVAASLPSQSATPCAPPGPTEPQLEIEADLGTGLQWYCPTASDNLFVIAARMRLRALQGSWCTVIPRTYIAGTGSIADQLRATYPWLGLPTPVDPATLVQAWAGQPDLVVDPARVWWFVWNGVFDPVTGLLSNDAVRDLYVPILADPLTTTHNTRIWDARPTGWLADQSGYGIGPTISGVWNGTLFLPAVTGDPRLFSTEGICRLSILLQAPSVDQANQFLESPDFYNALSVGMAIDLQAVSMIDSTGVTPGTTDLNAPGLGLPNLPTVTFTNPITVSIAIAAPATNGGGNGFTNVQPGGIFRFLARGIIPQPNGPPQLIFEGANMQQLAPVTIHADASLLNVFRFRVVPPTGVVANSTVHVSVGSLLPLTPIMTTPLTTVFSVQ